MAREYLEDWIVNYIEENPKLIRKSTSDKYPDLFVLKYSRKVFYDNLWDNATMKCRGLVVDKNNRIVSQPFDKVFNHWERGANMEPWDEVDAVRKVNGFMATVTNDREHGLLISSTGTLDSDFVEYAREMLKDNLHKINEQFYGFSFIFEICHPDDPHIINEDIGAYLIGVRRIGSNVLFGEAMLDALAVQLGFKRPEHFRVPFNHAVLLAKTANHEGYMLRRVKDDYQIKIKSNYYLMTKFLARKGEQKLYELLDSGADRSDIKKMEWVEEEFYDLIEELSFGETRDKFIAMNEQGRISMIRDILQR